MENLEEYIDSLPTYKKKADPSAYEENFDEIMRPRKSGLLNAMESGLYALKANNLLYEELQNNVKPEERLSGRYYALANDKNIYEQSKETEDFFKSIQNKNTYAYNELVDKPSIIPDLIKHTFGTSTPVLLASLATGTQAGTNFNQINKHIEHAVKNGVNAEDFFAKNFTDNERQDVLTQGRSGARASAVLDLASVIPVVKPLQALKIIKKGKLAAKGLGTASFGVMKAGAAESSAEAMQEVLETYSFDKDKGIATNWDELRKEAADGAAVGFAVGGGISLPSVVPSLAKMPFDVANGAKAQIGQAVKDVKDGKRIKDEIKEDTEKGNILNPNNKEEWEEVEPTKPKEPVTPTEQAAQSEDVAVQEAINNNVKPVQLPSEEQQVDETATPEKLQEGQTPEQIAEPINQESTTQQQLQESEQQPTQQAEQAGAIPENKPQEPNKFLDGLDLSGFNEQEKKLLEEDINDSQANGEDEESTTRRAATKYNKIKENIEFKNKEKENINTEYKNLQESINSLNESGVNSDEVGGTNYNGRSDNLAFLREADEAKKYMSERGKLV